MKTKAIGKPVELLLARGPSSFLYTTDSASLTQPYHYHAQAELVYCRSGQGTIFVGNYVKAFDAGDLFVIGKNLPHAILKTDDQAEAPALITVQFKEEFLGTRLFHTREFAHIDEWLKKSSRGLKYADQGEKMLPLLTQLGESKGIGAIIAIVRLIDAIAHLPSPEFLNAISLASEPVGQDLEKINKIFAYSEAHYKEPISLAQISTYVNFTETSFCRYFKSQTGKSYFQYLNEVRIANACRILLEEPSRDIEEVCFACGFNNPSNFYKQFKKIVRLTPKAYKANGSGRLALQQGAQSLVA